MQYILFMLLKILKILVLLVELNIQNQNLYKLSNINNNVNLSYLFNKTSN